MQLVEQHIIRKNDERYKPLDEALFKSKNLYNATLYHVRQRFIKENVYMPYATMQHIFQEENQVDYRQLPSKVAQQTMKLVDQNFRSFFKACKAYAKDKSKFTGRPKLPNYLDKKKGRCLLTYTTQAISKKALDTEHCILLSGLDVKVDTKITYDMLDQVRVVSRLNRIIVEVVYSVDDTPVKQDNGRYAAIDLGVNNLAAVTSNVDGFVPFLISGRPIKSISHYYNKRKTFLQSELVKSCGKNKRTSNRIKRLGNVRNNKIKDYMHKVSRMLVNHLVSSDIHTLVIGKNNGWKQDTNIGKVNNQNFVQIPFDMFIGMLTYKCTLEGISVELVNESHTSKCSFLDSESICHHDEYVGKRIKRGLFKSSDGRLINADINGSYNILRKCKPDAFDMDAKGVMGFLVAPVMLTANGSRLPKIKQTESEFQRNSLNG